MNRAACRRWPPTRQHDRSRAPSARRRARRHQPPARIGAPARGRRRALHRRPARTRRHAARRARPVAGGAWRASRRSTSTASARCRAWSTCCRRRRHPGRQRLRLDRPRRPDPRRRAGARSYLGQPVFAVIAETRDAARRAAAQAEDVLTIATPLPPILTPRAGACRAASTCCRRCTCGAARRARPSPRRRTGCAGSFDVGGQEQFYLEGQISYAMPTENDGMQVHCSTQHPSEMQHLVAHALGLQAHQVQVECRRMGGGFGGKESQSALFACVAAVAAAQLQPPGQAARWTATTTS